MTDRNENEEQMLTGLTMAMRTKLKANRHKGSWRDEDVTALLKGLRQEIKELGEAVLAAMEDPTLLDAVRMEAADVANFAGFIAHNADYDRGFGR